MKKINQYIGFLIVSLFSLIVFSCKSEDYGDWENSPDLTWVKSVRMVIDGDVYEGKMNENKKQIHFHTLPKDIDLSNVRFRGRFPDDNCSFDKDSYDFTMDPGEVQTTKVISVVNGKRKREYYVTLRLNTPPPGADFNKAKVYNFSAGVFNSVAGTRYADFGSVSTRFADMDLEHVLVVGRDNTTNNVPNSKPHLLRLSDLKQGVIDPIFLNIEGATGGTFSYNAGRIINGHVYLCNLCTSFSSGGTFKLYHWNAATPDNEPDLVANYTSTDLTAGNDLVKARYGDYMSLDVNGRGSGYVFSKVNGNDDGMLSIKLEGFIKSEPPTIVNVPGNAYSWATCYPVEGNAGEYLYSGERAPLRLIDGNGKVLYTVTAFPLVSGFADGCAARIINFNGARYLLTLDNVGNFGTGIIRVYNVSKGETTEEALKTFDEGDALAKAPLFSFSLAGSIPTDNTCAHLGFVKDGNDTLYIIGAAVSTGFAIVELPKTEERDPGDDSDEFFDNLDDEGYI